MGVIANGNGTNSSHGKDLEWAIAQSKVVRAESEKTFFTPDIKPLPFHIIPQHLRPQSAFHQRLNLRTSTMAQLTGNGASDHTDSPLSVEAIEESFRSLRITPGLALTLIQALLNISTTPTTDATITTSTTDAADATTAASSTAAETYGEETALDEPLTTAAASPDSAAVTTARTSFRDAVSTPASIANAATAPVATPAAATPIVAPPATLAAATPVLAPVVTMATAVPTLTTNTVTAPNPVTTVVAMPIIATPIVAAPTLTTAPAVNYHLPAAGAAGPFYCITRGRDIGVFAGWEHVSPLVIGVSRAVFGRVDSIQEGQNRMDAAVNAGLTARL
ncbi:uncharacterized protein LACBIDRAFT_314031 [Laccaria bicolor S238N-H82]|uniref:Predicted protein n=1 Tax=Laccaria bicolor (strain S238N-H82 / ATCC MYA-4686) TaxID=486041 RepID=B0D1F5_LACBS|nr:uncharacterized protein LACBIDRAFT_314031 [Laccaria bicolor S238N-H82]EDR11625.1 predicted protein [Laccaria bicolor S238N-H82]|eukprot:XP_001877522.1 predicted protein [Laccaria bicolor S238N-H82]